LQDSKTLYIAVANRPPFLGKCGLARIGVTLRHETLVGRVVRDPSSAGPYGMVELVEGFNGFWT
jgi:hypothetical protein